MSQTTRSQARKKLEQRIRISEALTRHYSSEANRHQHSLDTLRKLSPRDFSRIRKARGTHASIAERFGISRSYVSAIKTGHRGTHH